MKYERFFFSQENIGVHIDSLTVIEYACKKKNLLVAKQTNFLNKFPKYCIYENDFHRIAIF